MSQPVPNAPPMHQKDAIALLQVCPNDHPPFLHICSVYEAAVAKLGQTALTVFLSPPLGEPMAGAVYMDRSDPRSARELRRMLVNHLQGRRVALALCHRYRALQALQRSGLRSQRTVCVAHEFGFFRRARRRIQRRLFQGQVQFAGVSAPVVAELAETVANPLLWPNAIDLAGQAHWRLDRAAAQQALGLQAPAFNIGVVGRLHPKKQPLLALAGFSRFANEHTDAALTYLGAGELMNPLRGAAQGLHVNLAGFVADASRYLRAFDVLLIPSGEQEAFNMVALEAMAAGVLVVAGPAPGPRFVLGEAGVYFARNSPAAVASALAQAQALSGTSAALIEIGRQRAEAEFSVAAMAGRLEAWVS